MMETKRIPVLKEMYLAKLKRQVRSEELIETYRNASVFPLDPEGVFMETTVTCVTADLPELLVSPDGGRMADGDAQNAIQLHKALASLSPDMACDHRLWAYLTHGPYFAYCRARWPFGQGSDENNIMNRWLFGKGLQRNAIGRLWWSAHLTLAPWDRNPTLERYKKDDPYHYTPLLLGNQDIYQGLVDRDFGRSLVVRTVVLDVLDRIRPKTTNYTGLITRFLRSVNFLMKHTDLESVLVDELDAKMESLCMEIVNSGTSRANAVEASLA